MRTITIIGADAVIKSQQTLAPFGTADHIITGPDDMSASDGYHTFDELYDHRITLFIAFLRKESNEEKLGMRRMGMNPYMSMVWRSKLHSDGTMYDGEFILGLFREAGKQITYHIPLVRWEETSFAETLEKAPEWDGHTSADVIERLKKI